MSKEWLRGSGFAEVASRSGWTYAIRKGVQKTFQICGRIVT
jgi:hypothetical protein